MTHEEIIREFVASYFTSFFTRLQNDWFRPGIERYEIDVSYISGLLHGLHLSADGDEYNFYDELKEAFWELRTKLIRSRYEL